VPIAADTLYLKDAEVREFNLPPLAGVEQKITFNMITTRKKAESGEAMLIPFGEKRTVTLKIAE
jgi:hypothetical protein